MEPGTEVGDVGRVEGPSEELLDDGQEIVKGPRWRKRVGVRGSDPAPGGREKEGVFDEIERYSAGP